jgi:hypothetical protein
MEAQVLVEYRNVRQIRGEGHRRWFSDDYFDLIVWYDSQRHGRSHITGFQLCYDRGGYERALTWMRDRGYSHEKVDTGEHMGSGGSGGMKATPILVTDGVFDSRDVAEKFREAAKGMDPDIADLVLDKLAGYPG